MPLSALAVIGLGAAIGAGAGGIIAHQKDESPWKGILLGALAGGTLGAGGAALGLGGTAGPLAGLLGMGGGAAPGSLAGQPAMGPGTAAGGGGFVNMGPLSKVLPSVLSPGGFGGPTGMGTPSYNPAAETGGTTATAAEGGDAFWRELGTLMQAVGGGMQEQEAEQREEEAERRRLIAGRPVTPYARPPDRFGDYMTALFSSARPQPVSLNF